MYTTKYFKCDFQNVLFFLPSFLSLLLLLSFYLVLCDTAAQSSFCPFSDSTLVDLHLQSQDLESSHYDEYRCALCLVELNSSTLILQDVTAIDALDVQRAKGTKTRTKKLVGS